MANEVRKIIADLSFNENCYYLGSKQQLEISIPKQATEIEIINITNLDAPNRINTYYQTNNKNYFNDKLKVTIQVKNAHTHQLITYGKVNLYFTEKDKETINLTPQAIDVSKDGLVEIIHKPHNNGYYYAEYINDEDNKYYLGSTSNNIDIIMETIPVIIDFNINKPFVSPEESIKLSSTVTDVYGNNINYGTITFYTERTNNIDNPNDGYEYVLGDPVPVNNGYAEIEYSPIQLYNNQSSFFYNNISGDLIYTYDDTGDFRVIYVTEENHSTYPNKNIGDIIYVQNADNNIITYNDYTMFFEHDAIYNNIRNVEYIYAHYNYDNNLYGDKFKYYSSHRCKAQLVTLIPDTMSINIGINDNDSFKSIGDRYNKNDGFLHIDYDESLILQSVITDTYNNIITDFTNNDTITFYINGTTTSPNDNPFNPNDITESLDFNDVHQELIGRYNNQTFTSIMDTPLEPGYYTIYGRFEGNNKYLNSNTTTLYICVEEADVEVDIELNSASFNATSFTKISKSATLGYLVQSSSKPLPNDIWKELFKQKNCYLYLNNIKYECSLTYQNNSNKYQIKLLQDIVFTQPNNYYIKLVLPGGRYDNIFLPTANSSTTLIRVRLALKPYIKSLSVEKDTYPGRIKGIVGINNLFDETPTVTVTIDNNGQKTSKNYIYSGEDIVFTFDNIAASITQHQISAKIDSNTSASQDFTIKRANLISYLDTNYKLAKCDSKNKATIITGTNRNIAFIVESDGEDFTNYNINNINSINLAPCNSNNYIHPNPTVTKINNNKQLRVSYQQTLSSPNNWKTGIVFDGDTNYNGPDIEYFSFKTYTIPPAIRYTRDDDHKALNIRITDNDSNYINQYILIEIEIQDMNNIPHYSNIITNTNGTAILDCDNQDFESDMQWQNIQKVIFTTNPFNQNNINIIRNSNDKINTFKELYPNLQCGNTKTIDNTYISGIINQLIANDYQCFYTTYSSITDIQNFQISTTSEEYIPTEEDPETYNGDENGL